MEDVTFRVAEVDGVLADIRPVFNNLATAVLARPVEVPEGIDPPHTVSRLSIEAGLSADEQGLVRATIREIVDFWASVPAMGLPLAPYIQDPSGSLRPAAWPPIFHARRVQTRGRPVLLQTIEWLIRQGYENPVVWIEED